MDSSQVLPYASSNPLKLAKGSWAGFNWEAIIGISLEASAQDLGRIDPGSVKGVSADLQESLKEN